MLAEQLRSWKPCVMLGCGGWFLFLPGTIYGNQKTQPVRESNRPNPRSPYAVSKLAAEYYIRTIGALWGIETVCLRVFNAYGPGQRLPLTNAPVIPYCPAPGFG